MCVLQGDCKDRKESCTTSLENHKGCFKGKPEATESQTPLGQTELALLNGKLTSVAASLLKARLSDIEDDYPKKFPKHVLSTIEKHNECLRKLACELIDLKRAT